MVPLLVRLPIAKTSAAQWNYIARKVWRCCVGWNGVAADSASLPVILRTLMHLVGRITWMPCGVCRLLFHGDDTGAFETASEVVAVLRQLLQSHEWSAYVNKALLAGLLHGVRLPEDVSMISKIDDENLGGVPTCFSLSHWQRLWSLVGSLAVLGGNMEILRAGGFARPISGESKASLVSWIRPREERSRSLTIPLL